MQCSSGVVDIGSFDGRPWPLQGMGATGALTFILRSNTPGVTTVVAEYAVVGYSHEGLTELASAVDGVLGEAIARLASK